MNKLVILSTFILLYGSFFSQNKLEMYNNTDKEVFASYAYYDFENKCWSSKGWYKIEAYSTKTIELGNYLNDLYIHGETSTFWVERSWGNDVQFCIDPTNSFEIRFADKINCDKRKSFSKKKIVAGINKWTFNP